MPEIQSFNTIYFNFSKNKNFVMFFFLFLIILSNFLIIPIVKEKIIVKLAFAIPTGAPITVVKEIIDTPSFVANKTIKVLSM